LSCWGAVERTRPRPLLLDLDLKDLWDLVALEDLWDLRDLVDLEDLKDLVALEDLWT